MRYLRSRFIPMALLAGFLLLPACFDSDSSSDDPAPTVNRTVSGTAAKGLINKGTVIAYQVKDGKKSQEIAKTETTPNGEYTLSVGSWAGPVLIEVTGGSYKDEATGNPTQLPMPLRAAISTVEEESRAAITPLTEIAVRRALRAGFSGKVIRDANEQMGQFLKQGDILTAQPGDFFSGESDAKKENVDYTFFLAALAQMQKEHASLAAMMDLIEKDLEDQKPDQIKEALLKCAKAVTESIKNDEKRKKKFENSEANIKGSVEELSDAGFSPTGDLKTAKEMLQKLFESDPESESEIDENLTAFLTYMDGFVAETPEAHLIKGAAMMAGIYQSKAFTFITDADTGLGLAVSEDGFFKNFNQDKTKQTVAKLLTLQYEAGIQDLFSDLESRLEDLDDTLAKAQNATFSVSFAGMNTVYFDDIDVSAMRAIGKGLSAVCAYVQSIHLTAEKLTDTQKQELGTFETLTKGEQNALLTAILKSNPSLLTYQDASKRNDFKNAVISAQTHLSRAAAGIKKLDENNGQDRFLNAFGIDREKGRVEFEIYATKTLPAIIEAFDDATKAFPIVADEWDLMDYSEEPYPGDPEEPYPGEPVWPYPGNPEEPYPGGPEWPYPGNPEEPYSGDIEVPHLESSEPRFEYDSEENDESCPFYHTPGDGYAYEAYFVDVYLLNQYPQQKEITIYHLVSGKKSPRDILLLWLNNASVVFYDKNTEVEPVLFKENVVDYYQNSRFPTYEFVQATITIDGKDDDWTTIQPFSRPEWDFQVKCARDAKDTPYLLLQAKGEDGFLSPDFSSSFEISQMCNGYSEQTISLETLPQGAAKISAEGKTSGIELRLHYSFLTLADKRTSLQIVDTTNGSWNEWWQYGRFKALPNSID